MQRTLWLSLAPLAAAGLLAGCGGSGISTSRPAGAILQAANSTVLGGSFEMTFSAHLQADLSHVTGLSGVNATELAVIQDEINAATLQGTVEYQGPQDLEATFSLPPLLTSPWHVIDLNGVEYVSEDGSHWYQAAKSSSSQVLGGQTLSGLRAEFKTWGQQLKGSSQVVNLGVSTVGGVRIDHLQSTVPAAALNTFMSQALSGVLSKLPSSTPKLGGDLTAIEQLIRFTGARGDSYVRTDNGRLARATSTVGMDLELGALSLLAPKQSGLPSGYASLTFDFAGNLSDYGQTFNIQKPSQVLPGSPPTPSGLGGALSSL